MKLYLPGRREPAPSFESDPTLTTLLDQLRLVDLVPAPALRFEAPAPSRPGTLPRRSFAPSRRGVALLGLAAALFVGSALGLTAGLTRDGAPTVSAAAILEKATQQATAGAASSPSVFVQVTNLQTGVARPSSRTNQTRIWSDGARWRIEQYVITAESAPELRSVEVFDGRTIWIYDAHARATSTPPSDSGPGRPFSVLETPGESLQALIGGRAECWSPTLAGSERIAGRDAYVVDLGTNRCLAPEPVHQVNGLDVTVPSLRKIWVDHETFAVLKSEAYGYPREDIIYTFELEAIAFPPSIPEEAFQFDPESPAY